MVKDFTLDEINMSMRVRLKRNGGEKMEELRDQGFRRTNNTSGEIAKNVIQSGGKAGGEQGEAADGKVERNSCQKPWSLEKKSFEGSNRDQGGFVS